MGKEGKWGKSVSGELLGELYRRSGARCEGSKLGLDCPVRLTEDSEPLIHHIDGDPRNNETRNLALLCPNCHSKILEQLSEKRRKAYAKKVAERLDKSSLSNK